MSINLLLRLPSDLLHNYEAAVPTNPVFYKACTSGVAYTLGDFVSQVRGQVGVSRADQNSGSANPELNPNAKP